MDEVLRRNNVHVTRTGPVTMVFAHGFGGDQNTCQFVKPGFEKDHRAVPFDYVGSGHSDRQGYSSRRYRTPERHTQDLQEEEVP